MAITGHKDVAEIETDVRAASQAYGVGRHGEDRIGGGNWTPQIGFPKERLKVENQGAEIERGGPGEIRTHDLCLRSNLG